MSELTEFLLARLDELEQDVNEGPIESSESAYIVADIAAKRAMIEKAEFVWKHSPNYADAASWQFALKFVALPFKDRPGYLDEWKP